MRMIPTLPLITSQLKDAFQGRGLAGFPAVLGLRSYFLDVRVYLVVK